jgi:hypothetical protein
VNLDHQDYWNMSEEELRDKTKHLTRSEWEWHLKRWYETNYCETEERRPRYGRDYEEG